MPTRFRMREADDEDIRFIASLFKLPHARAFLKEPGRSAIAGLIEDPKSEAYIIDERGEDFGYFTMHEREGYIELGVLVVSQRGRGAGSFAMRWGIERAFSDLHARQVSIEIREDNLVARTMCERLGFKPQDLRRNGFRDVRTGRYKNMVAYSLLRDA